jgi:diguanylate cyclase (GGDEF)-like protein
MKTHPREARRGRPTETCGAAELGLALLERVDLPVVACDAIGGLALANAAARALWELPEQIEGRPPVCQVAMLSRLDGKQITCGEHPLRRALASESRFERLRVVTSGGRSQLVEVGSKPLCDPQGAVVGAMLTVYSVDRESPTEEQLRDYVSDYEILTEVGRMLAELQDADDAASVICTVATGASGAIAVLLWELSNGELLMRRHDGMVSGEALAVLIESARTGAAQAQREARTIVERPGVDGPAVQAGELPVGTAWHEPLAIGGSVRGVLSILWPGVLDDVNRPGLLIGALAHHAATALERAELMRRLNDAARTDPLTGLANRRVWQESLEHELARAQRGDKPLSLVLMDIDNFKSYNDKLGHPQGDVLLRDAARVWAQQLRSTDLLARVGGEEFAILLPACPLDHARDVAERVRSVTPHGQTCSLGIVTWDGRATSSELYETADAALYRAKQTGRNRCEIGHLEPEHHAA